MLLLVVYDTMRTQSSRDSSRPYTIVGEMNDHGAMTVVNTSGDAVFHIVEYDDNSVRRRLESLEAGQSVALTLDRAGARGNVWQASLEDSRHDR